jgi:hypothetical protein
MTASFCTTVSSASSDLIKTTVTHWLSMSYSTISNILQTATLCDLRILSEVGPKYFSITADGQATRVTLERLEASLAGSLLLIEYDGRRYRRLWTWLWKYGLSRDKYNTVHLNGDGPAYPRSGRVYVLAGCSRAISIHESVLEERWSGRLLIQEYGKRRYMLFKYLWRDLQIVLWEKLDTLRLASH